MRWALALAMHQHLHAPREQGDFCLLPGHDIRQVIDRAHEVGEFFFDLFHRSVRYAGGAPASSAGADEYLLER